jgi:hypothetical protein
MHQNKITIPSEIGGRIEASFKYFFKLIKEYSLLALIFTLLFSLPAIAFQVYFSNYFAGLSRLETQNQVMNYFQNDFDLADFGSLLIILTITFFCLWIIAVIANIVMQTTAISLFHNYLRQTPINLTAALRQVLSKFAVIITTSLRTFWYVLWPILVIAAFFALLFNFDSAFDNATNILLGFILTILLSCIILWRVFRIIFVYNAIIDSKEVHSSKYYLEKSIEATKGKWWIVFGNFLLMGIIIGAIAAVFNWIPDLALNYFNNSLAINIIYIIIANFLGLLANTLVFTFGHLLYLCHKKKDQVAKLESETLITE